MARDQGLVRTPGQTGAVVIWLGHSSYYVQVGGKRLLVDPVFSDYAAPLPFMVKAFEGTSIYSLDEIPEIDVVLISHDHYDHLDHATMKGLLSKTRVVVAGLGNGAHLARWGYPSDSFFASGRLAASVLWMEYAALNVPALPSGALSPTTAPRAETAPF